MAKDGTNRGGRRINQTGRPKKALLEKLETGNPGHRPIKVIDPSFNEQSLDAEAVEMPPIKDYLVEIQRDGKPFIAGEIYKETWEWLKSLKVASLVSTHLIEQYAISCGRYIQCEEMVNKYGLIAKHPTTGAPIQSPYVNMANTFMKQITLAWAQIYQIVKENSTVEFRDNSPQDNMMEKLMRLQEGRR